MHRHIKGRTRGTAACVAIDGIHASSAVQAAGSGAVVVISLAPETTD